MLPVKQYSVYRLCMLEVTSWLIGETLTNIHWLMIAEPPRVVLSTPSIEAQRSDTVRIHCTFTGLTTKVTRIKDGIYEPIQEDKVSRGLFAVGNSRVPTLQGKQGKWPKKFPVRENTGNLEMLSKHREFVLLKW